MLTEPWPEVQWERGFPSQKAILNSDWSMFASPWPSLLCLQSMQTVNCIATYSSSLPQHTWGKWHTWPTFSYKILTALFHAGKHKYIRCVPFWSPDRFHGWGDERIKGQRVMFQFKTAIRLLSWYPDLQWAAWFTSLFNSLTWHCAVNAEGAFIPSPVFQHCGIWKKKKEQQKEPRWSNHR